MPGKIITFSALGRDVLGDDGQLTILYHRDVLSNPSLLLMDIVGDRPIAQGQAASCDRHLDDSMTKCPL